MDIKIKKITRQDLDHFSKLISIFENVFEWSNFQTPNPVYLKKLLGNNHFIVLIAVNENIVVGGLTAYILDRYDSDKPSAYIYDIAVIKKMQRKGIGKNLITTFTEYCRKNKFSEAFVQAEMDDTQAINFYKKTPISGELRATHFTYSFENGKNK